ncbi:MAG TPA: VOC family protein [Nocardioides sp.]|jgi:PhnB protein
MASTLNPYIGFSDNAREALEFYQGVFGGTLDINTFGDFGAARSPDDADKVMHGMLVADNGFTLMGADTMETPAGSRITISLSGDDDEDLRGYWEKLSDGGEIAVPLEKQVWGDEFGQCTDKFGIGWMVNIQQPQP